MLHPAMPPKNQTPIDRPTPAKPTPPQSPVVGKPVVKAILTPDMRDRVIVVRRDIRASEYVEPKQGTPFVGVDEKETADDYFFATAQYIDPVGTFVDEYYLKSRRNQERYNFQLAYPYVNKNYPQITRTYICLRTDHLVLTEPDADASDPASPDLRLVDHKVDRVGDDPVLDSMFVKITRVFERLPSPVITSYKVNQFMQQVTITAQEVVSSTPPTLDALTETAQQERTGTAKAKNTNERVPRVFPASGLSTLIPSMARELWLGGFIETSDAETTAGTPSPPSLTSSVYQIDQKQLTEFHIETTTHTIPPQTRQHQEVTSEFGGGILNENLQVAVSGLTIDSGYLVTEAKLRNLPPFGQVKMTKVLTGAARWPVLHEEKVETDGAYAGIKILIDKQYVPAGTNADGSGPPYTPNPGGFTDMVPHDKWRTIQITSRIDPTSIPAPFTYVGSHPIDIPPTLLSVKGVYGDQGGSEYAVTNDGDTNSQAVKVVTWSGPEGTIAHTLQKEFHGIALALITRIFTFTPPTQLTNGAVIVNGTQYKPFKFSPVVGTASMFSTFSKFTQQQGAQIRAATNEGQQRIRDVEFTAALTGQFLATGPQNISFQGAASSAFAQTSDGAFVLTALQPGNIAKMIVNVPMSTPATVPPAGTPILAAVQVEEWRFGLWVIHLINAIIP